MEEHEYKPRFLPRFAHIVAWIVVAIELVVISAWIAGRIASDRFGWSQWLLWIPTPFVLCAAVIGLIALFFAARVHRRRRMLLGTWGIGAGAMFMYFGAIEHRMYRASPLKGEGVRIVHWSMSHPKKTFLSQAQQILNQEPDLAVLNDEWRSEDPAFQSWAETTGGTSTRTERFTILSKLPIIERRVLINSDLVLVVLLRVDAAEQIGRELTMLLVDLPSSPREPRWELAERVRRLLDEADAPQPDMVVGDLNLTRGSAACNSLFPSFHHAYSDAGGGYAASYHRSFPLYHIDHVLLDDTLHATSYRLVNPGVGRHRMQVATVMNR